MSIKSAAEPPAFGGRTAWTRGEIRAELGRLDAEAARLELRIRHYHCCGSKERERVHMLVWKWRRLQERMIRLEAVRPEPAASVLRSAEPTR